MNNTDQKKLIKDLLKKELLQNKELKTFIIKEVKKQLLGLIPTKNAELEKQQDEIVPKAKDLSIQKLKKVNNDPLPKKN